MAAFAHRILRFVDGRLVSDTPTDAVPDQPQTAGAHG
jgi:hypothetical protein